MGGSPCDSAGKTPLPRPPGRPDFVVIHHKRCLRGGGDGASAQTRLAVSTTARARCAQRRERPPRRRLRRPGGTAVDGERQWLRHDRPDASDAFLRSRREGEQCERTGLRPERPQGRVGKGNRATDGPRSERPQGRVGKGNSANVQAPTRAAAGARREREQCERRAPIRAATGARRKGEQCERTGPDQSGRRGASGKGTVRRRAPIERPRGASGRGTVRKHGPPTRAAAGTRAARRPAPPAGSAALGGVRGRQAAWELEAPAPGPEVAHSCTSNQCVPTSAAATSASVCSAL